MITRNTHKLAEKKGRLIYRWGLDDNSDLNGHLLGPPQRGQPQYVPSPFYSQQGLHTGIHHQLLLGHNELRPRLDRHIRMPSLPYSESSHIICSLRVKRPQRWIILDLLELQDRSLTRLARSQDKCPPFDAIKALKVMCVHHTDH